MSQSITSPRASAWMVHKTNRKLRRNNFRTGHLNGTGVEGLAMIRQPAPEVLLRALA
jgi:hypothetical protein